VAERLRRERQLGLAAFTDRLMADLRTTIA